MSDYIKTLLTTNEDNSSKYKSGLDKQEKMTLLIIDCLNSSPYIFNQKINILDNLLNEILEKEYRIMYNLVTSEIYKDNNSNRKINSNETMEYKLGMNIKTMIDYLLDIHHSSDGKIQDLDGKTQKKLLLLYKLSDHVSLAEKQSGMFIDTAIVVSKLNDIDDVMSKLPKLEEELNNSKAEIIMQLISLIGLFTALSFIVFGGFSLINAISIIIEHLPMIHIVMLTSIVGIIIFNLIALFILLVYKIANPKFKDRVPQEDYKSAYGDYILKIIKKTNYIMVGIIAISFLIIVCRNPKSLVF